MRKRKHQTVYNDERRKIAYLQTMLEQYSRERNKLGRMNRWTASV